jgi:CDGSH-type Zn-finger protein/uncharacterized Fe-S cluster protein YjdI
MSETRKARAYQGETITIRYEVRRCMHAAECVKSGLQKVFDNSKKPWVNPDGASPEKIIDVIERCPSGALTYDYKHQEVPETNSVKPQPDSAYYFRGDLRLNLAESALEELRLALCRCGQSKNKPFCDYSHHEAGFKDSGKLGQSNLSAQVLDATSPLEITPAPNGPLLLKGPFALRNADNTVILYSEKAALCRCGHSENKPLCDGTHKQINFQSE